MKRIMIAAAVAAVALAGVCDEDPIPMQTNVLKTGISVYRLSYSVKTPVIVQKALKPSKLANLPLEAPTNDLCYAKLATRTFKGVFAIYNSGSEAHESGFCQPALYMALWEPSKKRVLTATKDLASTYYGEPVARSFSFADAMSCESGWEASMFYKGWMKDFNAFGAKGEKIRESLYFDFSRGQMVNDPYEVMGPKVSFFGKGFGNLKYGKDDEGRCYIASLSGNVTYTEETRELIEKVGRDIPFACWSMFGELKQEPTWNFNQESYYSPYRDERERLTVLTDFVDGFGTFSVKYDAKASKTMTEQFDDSAPSAYESASKKENLELFLGVVNAKKIVTSVDNIWVIPYPPQQ